MLSLVGAQTPFPLFFSSTSWVVRVTAGIPPVSFRRCILGRLPVGFRKAVRPVSFSFSLLSVSSYVSFRLASSAGALVGL